MTRLNQQYELEKINVAELKNIQIISVGINKLEFETVSI